MAERCDLLLRGGMVIDGTGAAARPGAVAVRGDRIAAVGDLRGWEAEAEVEIAGLTVAPGFIDMHSHSDLSLLINPRAESKLRQGVTTEVIGQCGSSAAPAPDDRRDEMRAMWGSTGRQVEWTWGSFGDYLAALRAHPTSVNVAPVVGHGTIRAAVMGEENREPTPAELRRMEQAAAEAMEQGALGLSTGLVYVPSMYAKTAELIALARAIAPRKGIYFSHIRGEGEGLLEAIGEVAEISRQGGTPAQIAHLKASGQENWGKARLALAAIEEARARGAEVTFDVYPYTAWNTGLGQALPAWAREGGTAAMVERLRDPATRALIRAEVAESAATEPGRWERRIISAESEANRGLSGLTLAQIAELRATTPEEVVMDLLVEEEGSVGLVGFGMSEDDVRDIITHPLAMIGSDAVAVAVDDALGGGYRHPRTYGTFPRVLARYVREEKALSLEEAVAKMTSRPAQKLGLKDRGRIAPGMAADLVVFDPETIADRATYQEPHQYPAGIQYVIVNGVVELERGEHRDRRPGRVLDRAL